MNHNHWPEWITALRDDISPGGFLSPPFAQARAVCCCRKREASVSLKLPRFPGDVTEVYIIAEASAVEPRCRAGTPAAARLTERLLLGGHVASTWTEWGKGEQGQVERRGVR